MNHYTLVNGEVLAYPDPPSDVAKFLERVFNATADPNVDVAQLTSLIYSAENPLLDATSLPGRATITQKALDNPVYDIMTDQIDLKNIQLGNATKEDWAAQHTVSIPEAAEQLGIAPAEVQKAITDHALAAWLKNGQWYIDPVTIRSYKLSLAWENRSNAVGDRPQIPAQPAPPQTAASRG